MARKQSSYLSRRRRREQAMARQVRAEGKKLALAYVSLYADANEQMEDAQVQIDWAVRRASETGVCVWEREL